MRPARADRLVARGRLPALLMAVLVSGCRPEPPAAAVTCAVETAADTSGAEGSDTAGAEPAGAAGDTGRRRILSASMDTITVRVHVGEPPPSGVLRLMVRADPLSEPGAVSFAEGTPSTAAAVALALTERAVFHGCLGEAPTAFRLRASSAPRSRAWLRVSTDRPVSVRLTVGEQGVDRRSVSIPVAPGTSAEASWRAEGP
jgi:hypothetical protein